ncbi:hypothetical protein H8E50_05525 [bacterium]|nr:hypothetical protein [bacterium]
MCDMAVLRLAEFFSALNLTDHEREISTEILRQIELKLNFLTRVGLDYLSLNREARTLSGGEAQRINLASQLSSRLTGTMYVLDEPTVGLHPSDVHRISEILAELTALGNTIIIVEHDKKIMDTADWIVELGPGGGSGGGGLVFSGPREDFLLKDTLTSRYLRGAEFIPVPPIRRKGSGNALKVRGACGNNLKDIDMEVPLGTLACVTGLSGSGKSTLVKDTIYRSLAMFFKTEFEVPGPYRKIEGFSHLKGVKIIDQQPIGKSPRSNPVTYVKVFDHIRKLFAAQPQAKLSGYSAGHFSFNTEGGRCEACSGSGSQMLEMYFFEDLYVKCEECGGKRYKAAVLGVEYNGRNIHEVLEMTIDEAILFFSRTAQLVNKFQLMSSVGLGYLRLGQSATTLSGGESQRLKICAELGVLNRKDYLYILDEPTVGLHVHDVKQLLAVLNDLVDSGNTVLLVEHNLDVIKCCDYVIDIGPGGGEKGGCLMAEGTPEAVSKTKESLTGWYLKDCL